MGADDLHMDGDVSATLRIQEEICMKNWCDLAMKAFALDPVGDVDQAAKEWRSWWVAQKDISKSLKTLRLKCTHCAERFELPDFQNLLAIRLSQAERVRGEVERKRAGVMEFLET